MYAGINDPHRWVLPAVLAEQAERRPNATWIVTTEGDSLTYGQAASDVRRVAGYFASLGVRPGDRVALMLGNSCDFVRAWLGLGELGAVAVLLNTELRGQFLSHQLRNSGVELAVVDQATKPMVVEVADAGLPLRRLLVVGQETGAIGHLKELLWSDWRAAQPWDGPRPRAQDIAAIMYTSGTSGPAKGVLMPHAHCTLYGVGAIDCLKLTEQDRYYIALPLFHANGLLMQLAAVLLAGASAVLRPRFSASAWLSDVRTHQATVTNMLGAVAAFVINQPPTPHDRDHRLRAVMNGPNLEIHERVFRERFGIKDVLSGYGMTEVNIPVWGRLGVPHPGAAGWVYEKHFDVMIANPETDQLVPPGELGEILIRPKTPFGFMVGYLDMPDRTVEAWRNLWFHSGDAGTMDANGLVTFVDRIKDCIRRRGENIAATEVEAVVAQLPGIAEVAAFAVPSEIPGGEDEVMLAIVPALGATLSLADIGDRAEAALPRFARPRFLELVTELPKTATGKVQRNVLRKRGTATALDRAAPRPG